MPFASQLCLSLSLRCTCLLAHLLAHQEISLVRLLTLTHRPKLVTPSLANTQNLVKLFRRNSKTVKLKSPKPKLVRHNREPNIFVLQKLDNKSCRRKFLRKLFNRTTLLSECVGQFLFKIIRTKPQTMPRKLFFKLIRNCRISRCAISFSKLSAEDDSYSFTPR